VDLSRRLEAALGDAYRIERELGGGGMSRLFIATERSLNRRVVIKVLPPELASEVSAARFKREIELAAQLQHPHILPVLSAGAKDDLLYYVMPYVEGESLRHRLTRERPLPYDDALRILHEVADALDYAHGRGVVHRDIKPENILLEGPHAVLADFGVARALDQARTGDRLTGTGFGVGTPGYMAPEQASGEQNVDARADVFALAVVGYEMMAGVPPFSGSSAQAVLAASLRDAPAPLRATRKEVSAGVSNAVAKALAKAPNDRFPTAAAFRDALDSAKAPPAARTPARTRAIGAAALLAAVAAMALVARARHPAALDQQLVAVAPFDVLEPKLELWHEGLADVLSRNLDGAGSLRTVSPSVVVRTWSGKGDPAAAVDLGKKTGASLVVFGTILPAGGDSVKLRASMIDVASGRSVAEVERGDLSSRMDRLTDSLSMSLLREMGQARLGGAPHLGSMGSASLPAVKSFLQGEQYFRRAAWDSALPYYSRAISLDTTFALALWRYGNVLGWMYSAFDSTSEAFSMRAGRYTRGLAPRDSLLITGDSVLSAVASQQDSQYFGHVQRARAVAAQATKLYPADPEAWNLLGEVREHLRYYPGTSDGPVQVIDALDEAIRLDSGFVAAYIHPIENLVQLGRLEEARRYIAACLARHVSLRVRNELTLVDLLLDPGRARSAEVQAILDTASSDARFSVFLAFVSLPDSAETAVRVIRLLQHPQGGLWAGGFDSAFWNARYANVLSSRGHIRDAIAVGSDEVAARLPTIAVMEVAPREVIDEASRRQLQSIDNGVRQWMPWWGERGDTASLRTVERVTDSMAAHASSWRRRAQMQFNAEMAAAYLAQARHDTARALRSIAAMPDSACPPCKVHQLAYARLLEATGRDREAFAILNEFLRSNFLAGVPVVLAHLERARIAERIGQRDSAVVSYGYVADAWIHADPELQPIVAEAHTGLGRLGGEQSGTRVPTKRR